MKKIVKVIFAFVLSFTMLILFAKSVNAEESKVLIPVEITWNAINNADIPDYVNVKLYKYIGESFDQSTAIEVGSISIKAIDSWKGEFDITNEKIFDNNNNPYNFAIVQESTPGFVETEHKDPGVKFIPPSVGEAGAWEIVTPCENTEFESEDGWKGIGIFKQGNETAVWSQTELSQSEKDFVAKTIANTYPNFGTVNKFVYGDSYNYVSDSGHLKFEIDEVILIYKNKSDWSFFAMGKYYKSSTEANGSSITNTQNSSSISVIKVWNDMDNILGKRLTSVKVNLLNNDVIYDYIDLDDTNEWKHTFSNLTEYSRVDGNYIKNNFEIVEEEVGNGYKASYNKNENNITITNTLEVETIKINVEKIWDDPNHFIEKLPGVIVALRCKKDGNNNWTEIARYTLVESENWKHTFESGTGFSILPKEGYIYDIVEIGYQGLSTEDSEFFEKFVIQGKPVEKTKNSWTITNSCIATYELPEAGSHMGLIMVIMVAFLFGAPIINKIYNLLFIKRISWR